MKYSKRFQACVGGVVLAALLYMVMPVNTMKRLREPEPFLPSSVQDTESTSDQYKNEVLWVETSDEMLLEIPQWQINQSKVLQIMFVHQKGSNSKDNPIDASMITSDELALVQKALNLTNNLEDFREFYAGLPEDQKENLINSASKLEMQGLISLLMGYFFPKELQQQIGATVKQASGIIAPVVEYLKKDLKKDQILKGHKGNVFCVAYSPDGNYIVSGSADHNLTLWNGKTGEKIKILQGHKKSVFCVAYSPDGNYIVSGSADHNLILWNGKTGEKIKILQGHTHEVGCVAYSPDGNYIVSGSNNLILWNGKTGEKIKILKGHTNEVRCVVYSPDGNYIVSGSNNLILWNGKTGEEIETFEGNAGQVYCVAYSPDGNYIVSGAANHNLILWNSKTRKKIETLKGHTFVIKGVAYSPDGNYIISGSYDEHLILWDGKTGKKIEIFKKCSRSVACVAWSPDGYHIVAGLLGDNLILWNFIDPQALSYIANNLNIAQARFLYRIYLAKINNVPVILDLKDLDYQLYLTLPTDVQKVIKVFLPFELASDIIEKQIQEKMNEYRLKFIKTDATIADIIKTVKILMKDLDKNSVDYKACDRLLIELEREAAFEV